LVDFAPICPDAVFEVASTTDSRRALGDKMCTYVANGAWLAVLIDPPPHTVEIYAPDVDPRVLEAMQTVSLDPVLAGFMLDLKQIFN